jgi:hypothetical protein
MSYLRGLLKGVDVDAIIKPGYTGTVDDDTATLVQALCDKINESQKYKVHPKDPLTWTRNKPPVFTICRAAGLDIMPLDPKRLRVKRMRQAAGILPRKLRRAHQKYIEEHDKLEAEHNALKVKHTKLEHRLERAECDLEDAFAKDGYILYF